MVMADGCRFSGSNSEVLQCSRAAVTSSSTLATNRSVISWCSGGSVDGIFDVDVDAIVVVVVVVVVVSTPAGVTEAPSLSSAVTATEGESPTSSLRARSNTLCSVSSDSSATANGQV